MNRAGLWMDLRLMRDLARDPSLPATARHWARRASLTLLRELVALAITDGQ